jgi:hypothetical protein
MQTVQRIPDDTPNTIQRHEPDNAAVRATLDLILQSQPFRTSKQCQNLLSYIVDHSLHDDDASLRERILGIEVFGRAPDYDTSEDPVVRMRAADVRKRLAQFYQANEHNPSAVQIELKPGSYRAAFHYGHDAKESHPAQGMLEVAAPFEGGPDSAAIRTDPIDIAAHRTSGSNRLRAGTVLGSLLLVFLLGIVGWRVWLARSVTPQQRFWAPLIRRNQPVLLYFGANVAYRFTAQYMARYQKDHGLKQNGPEFFIDLPKGGVIQADDLLPVKDTFVSVADLAASTQVVSLLNSWGKPFNLRSAADITIGDLRNTPAIFIGGFNNTWTLETTNDLPYSFRDGIRIENKKDPAHSWAVALDNNASATEDFALISRLLHSNTGGPVLAIGGIGSFGTQAAAEFVSSPEKMNDLLKTAPAGWENKNMQAVLRIKVVGYAPVAVDVVATSYW